MTRTSGVSVQGRSSSPSSRTFRPRRQDPAVIPATSEDHEDEEIPTLGLQQVMAEAQQKKEQQTAMDRLAKFKASRAVLTKPKHINEDDFDIFHDPLQVSVKPRLPRMVGKGPDAKGVLHKSAATTGISNQRQAMLRRAGKSARPKDDATETFAVFAGRTFDHANLRAKNGGAKSGTVKKGRDTAITSVQMDAMMRQSHQVQVTAVQKKKEADWGRRRALPGRQGVDVEAVLELGAQRRDERIDFDEDEEEEDDEDDEDFVMSGDDEGSAGDGDYEEGEEEAMFSGDDGNGDSGADSEVEDEEDPQVIRDDSAPIGETDKENVPEDEDPLGEDITVIRRKLRPSTRIAVDSDDDDSTPARSLRQPLSEMQAPEPTETSAKGAHLGLSGFGGSPGFSQLFETTQAGTAAAGNVRQRCPFGDADLPGCPRWPACSSHESPAPSARSSARRTD